MNTQAHARTYNQHHIPRKYTPGKRRMSIYWTWSYPWESQRDPAAMENRFSTMTEVRNGAVAGLRDAGMERGAIPSGDRGDSGAISPLDAQLPANCPRGDRPSGRRVPTYRPGGIQAADR